ncbi:MAG TPA: hypothetical protein VGG07_14195 [Solirubrobacteraceae bacterium]
MGEYDFTLAIEGDLDYETLDALFEAGLGDADFVGEHSPVYATFHREAPSFFDAVMGAIGQIESVRGPRGHLQVATLDADDLVTMAEIADRLGRSRESVRLLVAGARGPGGFPPPALQLRDRTKLWLWSEVVPWANTALHAHLEAGPADVAPTVNAALRMRRGEARLSADQRDQLRRLVNS